MSADTEPSQRKVLYQGRLVLGWLVSSAVGFLVMLGFTWRLLLTVVPQVLTYLDEGKVLDGIFRLGIATVIGYITFLGGWQTWVGLRSIRRITVTGEELTVERVFGRWVGLGSELRIRRATPPPGFGLPYYRLEAGADRCVGEIIINWPENREGVERLSGWLAEKGPRREEV